MAARLSRRTPEELLSIDNVDGALVGGASLKARDFLGIAEAYPEFLAYSPPGVLIASSSRPPMPAASCRSLAVLQPGVLPRSLLRC